MSIFGSNPLAGQRTLILGGSGAMGAATAAEIIALGGHVLLAGRNEKKLDDVSKGLGPQASFIVTDISEPEALDKLLQGSGPIDHVVIAISANAAASSISASSRGNAEAAFSRFWVGYEVLQKSINVLPKTGSVTLISGSSARTPAAGYGVWTALHGAIESLARAASIDLAPLRVNVVSPGGIGMKPDRQLIERKGQARDVGAALALTLVNRAMTGAVIDVDSGERKGSWSG